MLSKLINFDTHYILITAEVKLTIVATRITPLKLIFWLRLNEMTTLLSHGCQNTPEI